MHKLYILFKTKKNPKKLKRTYEIFRYIVKINLTIGNMSAR